MKYIIPALTVFLFGTLSYAMDGNGEKSGFIYDVDYEHTAPIPVQQSDGNLKVEVQTVYGSYYLIKGSLGYLRINKQGKEENNKIGLKDISFVWLQPFSYRAYYSSLGKNMSLVREDPASPPFHLEDFLEIHFDATAYFTAKKLFEPSIEFSEKDGVIEALLPIFSVTVKKEKNRTYVTMAQRKVENSSYTCIVSEEDGAIRVESSEFKFFPESVARPINAKEFNFSLIEPPLLDGSFMVVDSRMKTGDDNSSIAYIYAGTIPTMEESKKMAELKTDEEWRVEMQDFYFDKLEPAPTTFEGLPEIMKYLKEHGSKPEKEE